MKSIYLALSFMFFMLIFSCGDNATKDTPTTPAETKSPSNINESERSIHDQVNAPGLKKFIGKWERADGYKETIEIVVDQELGVKVRFPKDVFYAHYNIDEDNLQMSGGVGMKLRYEKEKDQLISSRDFAYKRVK